MSNPRTPPSVLRLTGSPNLGRARKYEEADRAKPLLTSADLDEIAQLDALIQQAMKTCRHGHVRNGKRNPAFSHLAMLVKTRALIMEGKRLPEQTSTADILTELQEFAKKKAAS